MGLHPWAFHILTEVAALSLVGGCPAAALSRAVAGRVRGWFEASARAAEEGEKRSPLRYRLSRFVNCGNLW